MFLKSVYPNLQITDRILLGRKLLIRGQFWANCSGAPWLIPHLRHLRNHIPRIPWPTLCSPHLKSDGRKLLIKPHWAPRLYPMYTEQNRKLYTRTSGYRVFNIRFKAIIVSIFGAHSILALKETIRLSQQNALRMLASVLSRHPKNEIHSPGNNLIWIFSNGFDFP